MMTFSKPLYPWLGFQWIQGGIPIAVPNDLEKLPWRQAWGIPLGPRPYCIDALLHLRGSRIIEYDCRGLRNDAELGS